MARVVCGAADEPAGAGSHSSDSDGTGEYAERAGSGNAFAADGEKQCGTDRTGGEFTRPAAGRNLLTE